MKRNQPSPPQVNKFARHGIALVAMLGYMHEHVQSYFAILDYPDGVAEPGMNKMLLEVIEEFRQYVAGVGTYTQADEDYQKNVEQFSECVEYRPIEDLAVFKKMVEAEREAFERKNAKQNAAALQDA